MLTWREWRVVPALISAAARSRSRFESLRKRSSSYDTRRAWSPSTSRPRGPKVNPPAILKCLDAVRSRRPRASAVLLRGWSTGLRSAALESVQSLGPDASRKLLLACLAVIRHFVDARLRAPVNGHESGG